MNEKLEMAKNSLYNANEIKDIKENPVVESVLLAPIKAIPVLGDLIDSSTNKLLNDFQQKKEQELLDVILQDDHSITSEMVNDVEFIINLHEQKRQCKGWQRPIKLSILEILYEMVICRGNI